MKEQSQSESTSSDECDAIDDLENVLNVENDRQDISECFLAVGMSPLKLHAQPLPSRINLGKRKLNKAISVIQEKVARTLNVTPEEINLDISATEDVDLLQDKAENFDRLMELIKEKISTITGNREIIQVLTLAPLSWSIKKVAEFFNVTEYAARKARRITKEKGILALPERKSGKALSQDTIDLVQTFFEDDEFSRQMPGKKDYVSISRNIHKQKRLILSNLNELYANFKTRYPDTKIGFSKFCQLRPKWCVIAGSSGTHSVCVCTYHQNMKLVLAPINVTYHDLFPYIVCDVNSKECMVHRCSNCPDSNISLKDYLLSFIGDFDADDVIEFSQWTTTDRSNLIHRTETIDDYVNLVIEKLQILTVHSYISKCQSRHLKKLKAEIDNSTVLFLGDFAENYQFVVQDEVQGFHWNNSQCTLHPVVIYYKDNDELKNVSYCVISDDRTHDVAMVYEVQKSILADIKIKLPALTNVIYFSDGCAGQYKNRKNFYNLCHHKTDFDLDARWLFFATSHGKQPCDGIGGTVKRLVANASLKRDLKDQIMTPEDMFTFCKEKIENIIFKFLLKADVDKAREFLKERFEAATRIPGTRSFHEFTPKDQCYIEAKRTSEDSEPSYVHNFNVKTKTNFEVQVLDYVTCLYDKKWWVGIVTNANKEEGDVEVKFMHPHGPSRSFKWPHTDDICWVPNEHMLFKIEIPTTSSGRSYNISENDRKLTEQQFLSVNQ